MKSSPKLSIFTGILVFILGSGVTLAQDSTEQNQESNSDLDEFHDRWSKHVLDAANRLDSFFGNQRVEEDAQQTRIRVNLDYEAIEGEDDSFGGGISAKIRLPRLDERVSLVLSGRDSEDGFDDADDDENDADRSLAIRIDAKSTLLKNVSFDFGIRRPEDDYELFVRGRHRFSKPLGTWVTRLDNKLYYHNDFGFEYDGKLDFDLGLPPLSLFRARSRVRWWEADSKCNGGFCPEQHFFLYQRMKSPRHALAYEFSTFFQTDPDDGSDDYVDKSRLRLRYRHNTKYDWLFVELRPTLTFDRENDYNGNWSFLVRLEGIFGYQPKYETLDFGPERALDN